METDDEEEAVHRRADHRDPAGTGSGAKTADLARKHGVSEATLYNRKAKFGGMEVSDARRPKALEDETGKLKRLLADAMLDNTALKDLLSRQW